LPNLIRSSPPGGVTSALSYCLPAFLVTLAPDLHITVILFGRQALKAAKEEERYGLTEEQKGRIRRIHHGGGPIPGPGLVPAAEVLATV